MGRNGKRESSLTGSTTLRVDSMSESPTHAESEGPTPAQDGSELNIVRFSTGGLALAGEAEEGFGAGVGLVPELWNHHGASGQTRAVEVFVTVSHCFSAGRSRFRFDKQPRLEELHDSQYNFRIR